MLRDEAARLRNIHEKFLSIYRIDYSLCEVLEKMIDDFDSNEVHALLE